MSDGVIAFFEFIADRLGDLRFGVINVMSQTLVPIASFSSMAYRRDNDDCLLEENDADIVHMLLEGKIWFGHDIGSEYPRLMKAFAKSGIAPPKAKSIFDTRILLLSDMKFAKIAVHFGFGKIGRRTSYDDLLQNINAIKLSEDVMSLYEPEKMKKYVGRDFHPMICYLMDLTNADVDIVEWIANMMEVETKKAAELLKDRVPPATNSKSIHDKNFTGKAEESNKRSTEANTSKKNANTKRKVSGVIDTTGIPEVTCQTENDIEKGVVSLEANQIVDNIVTKKFVLDAANPVKDSVHSKRQCVRRKSTRFDVQETEQTEKLLEMDDAKEIKETARLSLRRQSARLKPEDSELCKSFHEREEVRETIKRRRSDGSRSEAVEPSESRHDTKGKRRVSTRRQPTKGKSETATDNDGAIQEIATEPSMRINIVEECVLRSSSVSQEDHERESKNKPRAEETEGMMRRTSVGRPSRHAAEKVQSYREVSLKVKMRRNC